MKNFEFLGKPGFQAVLWNIKSAFILSPMAKQRRTKSAKSKKTKTTETEAKETIKIDAPPVSEQQPISLLQNNRQLKFVSYRETFSDKLLLISESNFFWGGGIAIALGSYAFLFTPALKFSVFLLVVSWVVITISIFKHNFFERKIRNIHYRHYLCSF